MRFFVVMVLLATLPACGNPTEPPRNSGNIPSGSAPGGSENAATIDIASGDSPSADAAPETLPSGGPALSDPQIKRLFAVTWVADKDATIGYPANAENAELKADSSKFSVPLSYEGSFKDAGFLAKSKMLREPQMFEIDYASPDASDTIRVLDDNRFALNVGPCWIVFSERQAKP